MFNQARLKLTAWYLLIIMIISLSFSAIIYQLISMEMNRFANSQKNRIERSFVDNNNQNRPPPIIILDDDLLVESKNRLLFNLAIINGVINITSGSFAYFFASLTLSPIQKMTEEQKRFVSDASHELRTPLTALKALFEVSLRDPKLNLTEAKKVIKNGISQTNQLKTLSDSLLELNHLQNNGSSFEFKMVSIKEVMDQTIQKIKLQTDKKQISIQSSPINGKIKIDPQKIEELFLIILDNAVKYSPKSSQIKFIAEENRKNFVFKIIDQGIGISPEDLNHIFDRFYRADNARTKNKSSSYGLGLSIAQKIVTLHQGKIEVSSKINKGTIFTIYLPKFS